MKKMFSVPEESLDNFFPKNEEKKLTIHREYLKNAIKNDRDLFNFSHPYFKLTKSKIGDTITTIRSTRYDTKQRHRFDIPCYGWLTLKRERLMFVKVERYIDKKISDFSLKLLQKDANYPKHYILSHSDFVDILNSFTRWNSNKLETIKRCFLMRIIKRRGH